VAARQRNEGPSRGGAVALGCWRSALSSRYRAGGGTLAASPGCRARHRARTLGASPDSNAYNSIRALDKSAGSLRAQNMGDAVDGFHEHRIVRARRPCPTRASALRGGRPFRNGRTGCCGGIPKRQRAASPAMSLPTAVDSWAWKAVDSVRGCSLGSGAQAPISRRAPASVAQMPYRLARAMGSRAPRPTRVGGLAPAMRLHRMDHRRVRDLHARAPLKGRADGQLRRGALAGVDAIDAEVAHAGTPSSQESVLAALRLALREPEALTVTRIHSGLESAPMRARPGGWPAHRGVVHAEVAADGTHDGLSRVEADPDVDIVSL
jgi:hypothetical protein